MKDFKDQQLSKRTLEQIKGGFGSSNCTNFYARGIDAGEGDACEFAITGQFGTIQNGLCCA